MSDPDQLWRLKMENMEMREEIGSYRLALKMIQSAPARMVKQIAMETLIQNPDR